MPTTQSAGRVPEREGGRLVTVRDQDVTFGASADSVCSPSQPKSDVSDFGHASIAELG